MSMITQVEVVTVRNHEVEILKQQLDELERNIQKEEDKAYDLETKSK